MNNPLLLPHIHSELTLWSSSGATTTLGTTTLESPVQPHPATPTALPPSTPSPTPRPPPPPRPTTLHKILPTLRGAIHLLQRLPHPPPHRHQPIRLLLQRQSRLHSSPLPKPPSTIQLSGHLPWPHPSLSTAFPPPQLDHHQPAPVSSPPPISNAPPPTSPPPSSVRLPSLDPNNGNSPLGPTLADLFLSNHPAPPTDASTSSPSRMSRSRMARIDRRHPGRPRRHLRTPATFSLPDPTSSTTRTLSPAISRRLAQPLRHVNPLFADLSSPAPPPSTSPSMTSSSIP